MMKLIAALAALVPRGKSKTDDPWPYKVVELQSSGYGDKPIVTCEYFEDSYEKARHTMRRLADESYKNGLSRMSLDFRPQYTVTDQYAIVSGGNPPWKDIWVIMKESR